MAAPRTQLEKVNDQQEKFCQDYALRLNATEAAKNAEYHPDYGRHLITLPHIIERIAEIQRMGGVRMIVTQAKVIRETAYLAYSDITEALGCSTLEEIRKLPEHVRKAIKSVKYTRTPVLRYRRGDQVAEAITARSRAMLESDDNCHEVTNDPFVVVYEETITIEMHPKVEPLKLLSLVSGAVTNPEDREKLTKPTFTGMDIKTVPAGSKQAETEQKDNDKS
jgi:phage terminase small subunit